MALPREISLKYWKNSFYWSVLFFLLWGGYFYFYFHTYTFGSFVGSLEAVAAVMIAISYALGTFTYYTDVLDRYLTYRKYFGLVGYCYLVLYFLLWVLAKPEDYLFAPLAGHPPLDFLLLVAVLLILSGLAVIGNDQQLIRKHPKLWRNLLRFGYVIYAFWIPRSYLLDRSSWLAWHSACTLEWNWQLPPPSLVFTTLGLCVVLFRLSVLPVKVLKKLSSPP